MDEIRDMELLLRAATLFAGGIASLSLDVSKAILPISASQMARMANELGNAAGNKGVSNVELLKAAEELTRADDTRRAEAVSGLIHACVKFAHDAVNAGHDDLMHSAIDLVLAGRSFLRVEALGSTASLSLDVSNAIVPISASQMARMANELGNAAGNKGVSSVELLNAAEELTQADDTRRAEAVSGLIHACVTFAHDAVNAGHNDLMHSVIDLALAGRCFLRVAALGTTEGPAAAQPNHKPEEQITGVENAAWWARKKRVGDLEEHLLQRTSPASSTSVAAAAAASSSSEQTKGSQTDNWAGIHLFCLGGSLSLLPYLGNDGLLMDKVFSDDYRWWVSILLMLWWCLVSFGVTCSLFGRSSFELQYARFSSYLGMFGISALVVMFLHWSLAINSMIYFYYLLAGAGVIFLIHWIWCCCQRDK